MVLGRMPLWSNQSHSSNQPPLKQSPYTKNIALLNKKPTKTVNPTQCIHGPPGLCRSATPTSLSASAVGTPSGPGHPLQFLCASSHLPHISSPQVGTTEDFYEADSKATTTGDSEHHHALDHWLDTPSNHKSNPAQNPCPVFNCLLALSHL